MDLAVSLIQPLSLPSPSYLMERGRESGVVPAGRVGEGGEDAGNLATAVHEAVSETDDEVYWTWLLSSLFTGGSLVSSPSSTLASPSTHRLLRYSMKS